jgi:hypothetical protein
MPDVIIPQSFSANTPLQPSSKRLREQGYVDLHSRIFDEMGKAADERVVKASDFDNLGRIVGMLVDCSSWPAIGFREADTSDETSASNLDTWILLDWQNTVSLAAAGNSGALALNPACQVGVTFNGAPFRSYGYSQNNPGNNEQQYQAFKFVSATESFVPDVPGPGLSTLTGPGKQYTLEVRGGGSGFLAFDGADSKQLPGFASGPGWAPHDATLWAVTATGAKRIGGSGASYLYVAGTQAVTGVAGDGLTEVYVDLRQCSFTGGVSQGDITVTLIKYEMGDEIPWASKRIAAGTANGNAALLLTFSGMVEDDYAVRIEYANPTDSVIPLFRNAAAGNTIQTGAQPILFYFASQAPMVMTWHSIPELNFMLYEGEGFRGLAMHVRLYYNGTFGSNGAPNGDIAACKLSQANGWRQLRDNCIADSTYNPMKDIAVYGPNRDEMSHIVHNNVNGLRYFEKTSMTSQPIMESPWIGSSAFSATKGGAGTQNWVDSIVEPAEYTLGHYTFWCIYSSNAANLAGGGKVGGGAGDGYGCKFALEISFAIERKVVRQSIMSAKTPARAADWQAAVELVSNIPWAYPDTGFSYMDLFYHPNLEGMMTPAVANSLFLIHKADEGHKKLYQMRLTARRRR